MLISRVAIKRPVFTMMIIGALIVFGYVSLTRLGIDHDTITHVCDVLKGVL